MSLAPEPAPKMSVELAHTCARDMTGPRRGSREWAPAEVMEALEVLSLECMRLSAPRDTEALETRISALEKDLKHAHELSDRDHKDTMRAHWALFDIENLAKEAPVLFTGFCLALFQKIAEVATEGRTGIPAHKVKPREDNSSIVTFQLPVVKETAQ